MKKILIFLLVGITSFLILTSPVYAAEDDWEKTFTEDFDAYETGKVENSEAFKNQWTNDLWSGTNPSAVDINDVGQIKQEGDNKYLNLNYSGDFFYIAPHNMRARELDITMDVRLDEFDSNSWIGINTKKAYRDTRYNGGTGLLVIFKHSMMVDESSNVIGEAIVVDFFRSGSLSLTDLNADAEGPRKISYVYPEEGKVEADSLVGNWNQYKISVDHTDVANEVLITVTVNDTVLATLTHRRASLNLYGYTSLNSTLGNFDVDNFKIESKDLVAPPPVVRILESIPLEGDIDQVFKLPGNDKYELIDDADGKVQVVITPPTGDDIELPLDTFEFTPTQAGIYTIKFIAERANGTTAHEEFSVNIKSNGTNPNPDPDPNPDPNPDPDPDPNPDPNPDPDDEPKEGLDTTTVILIISGVVVILGGAAATLLILKKKR